MIEIKDSYRQYFRGKSAVERIRECDEQLRSIRGSWEAITSRMDEFLLGSYDPAKYSVERSSTGARSQVQPCMASGCSWIGNGERTIVKNILSDMELWLSQAIIHMTKKHKLLQIRELGRDKESYINRWGIDPKDFYEYFML